MKQFFIKMLSNGGSISSKRVIMLASFILLGIAFILDLFFDVKVSDKLVDVMEMLVISGFGGTVLEKFTGNKNEKEEG